MSSKKFDIFLSYNWDSKNLVKLLYKRLTSELKYKVWLDDIQLDSRNLFEQLIQGINDSSLFLCCITKKYSQSDNCIREINYASINKKPLVIVMLERLNINELGSIGFIIASLTRFNFYTQISNENVWSGEIFESMVKSIEFNLSTPVNLNNVERVVDKVENQVKFFDNGRYEGDLTLDGRIHGNGTFHFNDGQKYVGEWVNFKKTGMGIWYHVNGDRYEGEFLNDLMHGRGVYYFKSGNKYDGDWIDGKRTGKGIYFYKDGTKYEGDFVDNKKEGLGTLILNNGDKYVGEYLNDEQNGQGIYWFSDGDRYEGEFLNGKKHGKGSFYYSDGDKYVGEYQDDEKNGYGVYYFMDTGERYEGDWANDMKHGKGVYYTKKGEAIKGKWLNDKKV